MQVILLAAGMGLRLGHLTQVLPKAMIIVNQVPVIDYTLGPLLANKQVKEVLIVGGFEFQRLREHIEKRYQAFGDRVRILENKQCTWGNLYSVKRALSHIEKSFLICNVDHIYSSKTWNWILTPRKDFTIFADLKRPLAPDEMKIVLNDHGNLQKISKTLPCYQGGYVGLTYVPHSQIDLYKQTVSKVEVLSGEKAVAEEVLAYLASQAEKISIEAFDQHRWWEVDTPEDLRKAQEDLSSKNKKQQQAAS